MHNSLLIETCYSNINEIISPIAQKCLRKGKEYKFGFYWNEKNWFMIADSKVSIDDDDFVINEKYIRDFVVLTFHLSLS